MDTSFLFESAAKLIAAAVCGALLGLERKSRNHAVGMRTLVLICVSSTLLSLLSAFMSSSGGARGDPSRIAAGVISGIGFLGGGAIMKQGLNITGLTSAAVIWTASSFGLAIGGGLWLQVAVALVLVLLLLVALEKLEERLFPAVKTKTMLLTLNQTRVDLARVTAAIASQGLIVSDVDLSSAISTQQTTLRYKVKVPKGFDFFPLIDSLMTITDLADFAVTN